VEVSWPGWRGDSDAASSLPHQLLQGITLLRLKVAQLVLNIDPVLAAQVEQVLALHVQLARQDVNSNFLSILQAARLLCRRPP
jgi:hypothetical protein